MDSWVWKYFKKIDNNFLTCIVCSKRIARGDGTKDLICHLKVIHKIAKDKSGANDLCPLSAKQRRSWLWNHFSCTDKEKAVCKHCHKIMSHLNGTKGLTTHLMSIHSILKPKEMDEPSKETQIKHPKMCKKRSWVWEHFASTDKERAVCNHCHQITSNRNGTNSLMNHLKSVHSILRPENAEENDEEEIVTNRESNKNEEKLLFGKSQKRACSYGTLSTPDKRSITQSNDYKLRPSQRQEKSANFLESKTASSINTSDCFVCNEQLTSCRTNLFLKTKFTEQPLYLILEAFIGSELDETTRNESLICHECLNSFQQYDKWQFKSSELQRKIRDILSTTDKSEQIFIKEEPDESEEENDFEKKEEPGAFSEDTNDKKSITSDDDWSPDKSSCDDESSNIEPPSAKRRRVSRSIPGLVDEQTSTDEECFCVTCSLQFDNAVLFELHLSTDHDRSTGPFNCPKCSKSYVNLKLLKSHFLNHSHLRLHYDKDRVRDFPAVELFECPYSPGKMFTHKKFLNHHVRDKHSLDRSEEDKECKTCGIELSSILELNSHLENEHATAETQIEKYEPAAEFVDVD